MYFFLYGEDTYSIRQKVEAFRQKYQKESNALFNHVKLDGAKLSKGKYLEAVLSMPFLMEKKLVEVRNAMLENSDAELKKYIAENLDKIPDSTIVLFIEYGLPDARTMLFKALNKPKVSQKFLPMRGSEIKQWIKAIVRSLGGVISDAAAGELEVAVGSDLSRLENEITKLVCYKSEAKDKIIEPADVARLVSSENQSTIFEFTDALAAKNKQRSVEILHQLLEGGENEIYILSMMTYQFRGLLQIANLLEKGQNQRDFASITKLHPYVVQKMTVTARRYSYPELTKIFLHLYETDLQIKTGIINPRLAVDLLVVDICGK